VCAPAGSPRARKKGGECCPPPPRWVLARRTRRPPRPGAARAREAAKPPKWTEADIRHARNRSPPRISAISEADIRLCGIRTPPNSRRISAWRSSISAEDIRLAEIEVRFIRFSSSGPTLSWKVDEGVQQQFLRRAAAPSNAARCDSMARKWAFRPRPHSSTTLRALRNSDFARQPALTLALTGVSVPGAGASSRRTARRPRLDARRDGRSPQSACGQAAARRAPPSDPDLHARARRVTDCLATLPLAVARPAQ
jgi:hypothetical protein